jgi:hypothetical protein
MTSSPKHSSSPIRSLFKRLPIYPAFKQVGHYPDYWYWKLRGEPRRIPHLLKQRAVLEYARRFELKTLVETGTYYGEMIAAVAGRFDQVYSIELDPRLATLAQQRFRGRPHVHVIEGDSQKVVPELLQQIDRRCLWWLDAGYCGWVGEIGNPNRLGSEFQAILADRRHDHVILMDDADGINGEGNSPTLPELIASIEANYPNRQVEVARNIIRITPRGTSY